MNKLKTSTKKRKRNKELHLPREKLTAMKKLKASTKKRKRSEEFHLPQEIIHRIQSCMDEKASARTALVSKLWYRTWLTRPNLAFDGDELQDSFSEYTKKTMQMYEDLNLTIESFRLRIRDDRRHHFHAEKLIPKAMNLGAFDLDINFKNRSMVLTKNILQSETLARLSLSESRVYLKRKKEVIHSKLKSLNLSRVTSQVDLFRDFVMMDEDGPVELGKQAMAQRMIHEEPKLEPKKLQPIRK